MCGIVGIIDFEGKWDDIVKSTHTLSETIKHRGPDDEGYVFFGNDEIIIAGGSDTNDTNWHSSFPYSPKVRWNEINANFKPQISLAHRRLSIVDVSAAGHQPMCDASQQYWIVYNGEIYNYVELRKTLTELGHTFYSNTDTEVLLNAYIQWGKDMCQYLNGMWAYAIYDRQKQEIVASRDRFGVKPFYYIYVKDKYFAFASEQKALIKIPLFKKRINDEAVYDFFVNGTTESQEESFFSEIKELKPATNLTINHKSKVLEIEKYYKLNYTTAYETFSKSKFDDYVSEIKHLLESAVKSHLMGDVPIGASLSGGIDSSALVALIRKINPNYQLKVFTSSVDDASLDETRWAQLAANHVHATMYIDYTDGNQLMDSMEKLVYQQDIPFFSPNTFMHYSLMNKVKEQGIKVSIDGQGADEIFTGYAEDYAYYVADQIKNGAYNSFLNSFAFGNNSFANKSNLVKYFTKNAIEKIVGSNVLSKLNIQHDSLNKYFNPAFTNNFFANEASKYACLNEFKHSQITETSLKGMLRAGDRNSMAFGIESRVPFADDIKLIEKLFAIGGNYKIRQNTSKILLRESVKDIIPPKIYERKDKMGFASPWKKWVKDSENHWQDLLTPQYLEPYFDAKKLMKNKHIWLDKGNEKVWRLISFIWWRKVFKI